MFNFAKVVLMLKWVEGEMETQNESVGPTRMSKAIFKKTTQVLLHTFAPIFWDIPTQWRFLVRTI